MSTTTFELTRALAYAELTGQGRARAQALAASLIARPDANALVAEIANAGMMPLAYRHLVAGALLPATSPLAAALSAEFHAHAGSRFTMTRRLRDVVSLLEDARIDTLAHKGPALAIALYGNFAMRQYGDIDLIVRPADAERAVSVLVGNGWRPLRQHSLTPGFATRARGHEVSLIDHETSTLLELHWTLTDRFDDMDVPVDWLMTDAVTIDLIGRPVRAMRAERLLLALAIHGARHLWPRLSWLADLADLLRQHPELDWDVVLAEAQRIHFARALATSLVLAHDVVDAPMPPWIGEDTARRRSLASARVRLEAGAAASVTLIDRARWEWSAANSLSKRAAVLWRVATTPSFKDGDDEEPPATRWRHVLPRGVRLVRTAIAERRAARHRG